jgi:hypothetical protein
LVIGTTGVTVTPGFFFVLSQKINSNPAAAIEAIAIKNPSIVNEIKKSCIAGWKYGFEKKVSGK